MSGPLILTGSSPTEDTKEITNTGLEPVRTSLLFSGLVLSFTIIGQRIIIKKLLSRNCDHYNFWILFS